MLVPECATGRQRKRKAGATKPARLATRCCGLYDGPVKFLHAADIHLDSPLAGQTRRGTAPERLTRDCTRQAFRNLIDLAIAEDVAFVVIAGDLYDADWRDFSTGLFFAGEMRRLAGRPCILVRGNHDAGSVITRNLEPPGNVRVFSTRRAETFRFDEFGVALHGRSFPTRAVEEDFASGYPPPIAGLLNIGVLHTSAEDPGEHEVYAPCSVGSLAVKGYEYWALGHIHQRRVLHERPWIVFPGNLQGRHPREVGAKGCMLVEVEEGRIVAVTPRATDVLRWGAVTADLGGAAAIAEILARVRMELAGALAASEGRPLIVRLTLAGATAQHAAMLADLDAIEAECRAAAAQLSGELYIERVRVQTRPAGQGLSGEAAAQLAEAFLAGLDDPAVVAQLLEDFRAIAAQMPGLKGREGAPLPQSLEALRDLAPEAWQIVAHALAGGAAP